jgi:deazaflavin-dependent oxidoreductase (nitroreductase family)
MSELDERNARNEKIMVEFRANRGQVAGRTNMIIITHTGAKSGNKRSNPLVCLQEGGRQYIFASRGGADYHPAWYHNIVANPRVTVEVGAEKFDADAEVITGPEHDRIYSLQVAANPVFGQYQGRTKRVIPVVALNRVR